MGSFGAFSQASVGSLVAIASANRRELESEYVDLFERGVDENPLHEGGWVRELAFGGARRMADVSAFYRAFGVGVTERASDGSTNGHERIVDHS